MLKFTAAFILTTFVVAPTVVMLGVQVGIMLAEPEPVKPVHIPIYRCLDRYCNKFDPKDMNPL